MNQQTKQRNTFLITLTLGLGAVIGTLNITMFNVALPTMMTAFNASLATVQWLTSGYMLAAGMIIPAAGFLGDRFGYKRIFSLMLCCVFVFSIMGALAWRIEVLIAARFLMGLTGGLLSPLSLAMLYQALPANEQAKAASTWGMANMVGGMLPAVLSGFILSVADWRFLLLFNIPFVVLALFLTFRLLPQDSLRSNARLDIPGLALTSMGSMILLFTFSNLSSWGFSAKLLLGILLGAGCLTAYVLRSRDRADALLNLRVLKFRRYSAALIIAGMNSIAMYLITFLMPLFLQSGLGVSPLMTGLIMLPTSLIALAIMPVATICYPKLGEKALMILGIVVLLLGSSPFLTAVPTTPILLIVVAMCVRSCGMGTLNMVATNAQMSSVPQELSGHASSLTNWFQQMLNALVVGIASNVADLRIAAVGGNSPEGLAFAYTSTTNLMMAVSCLMLLAMIPMALKFFRSKAELGRNIP